jgi:SAM-dependent methyltransferase
MQLKPIALAKGVATFVPGLLRYACGRSFGSDSPRYCYSVWLRHLKTIAACGLPTRFDTVAELGPGDSLGIGLAAMLTMVRRYYAFDAVPHARTAANLAMLDRQVELVRGREPIPSDEEFPEISPHVDSLEFPRHLLDDRLLDASTAPARVDAIRRALSGGDGGDVAVRYAAPWADAQIVESESVDLALSQAVLEHVDDVDAAYQALFRWLKPGGIMSHAIDFRCHGLTRDWYGHWTIPAYQWRLVRGRRPYLINRLPASRHFASLERAGFEIVHTMPRHSAPAARKSLARPFRDMTDDDARTSGVFVIARKPGSRS